MATSLADLLFYACAGAIVVAQLLILVSTARGIREARSRGVGASIPLEWAYAVVPALALLALIAWTWLAMHPHAVHVEGVAPNVGSIS